MAVYSLRPWRLLYPLRFNAARENDWESGDANETPPPPPLIPILHSEWLLSSPRSYKSDGAREEEED